MQTMPKPKNNDIPLAYLRECLDYDPATKALTWKHRPRQHFATTKAWATSNARCAGTSAGSDSTTPTSV
jgi:hypothetical protein